MAVNTPVYPVTASVGTGDLVQIQNFNKVAPPFVAPSDLVNSAQPIRAVYNTVTATTTATLTPAQITGGLANVVIGGIGTLANATGYTLPTVASVIAAVPTIVPGQSYMLRVINKSSANFTITMLTSTGGTLRGTMTASQNNWRDFIVTFTSLSAATLQEVGTGTDS